MPLIRLIYSSHTAPGFSRKDLGTIGEKAMEFNTRNAITGALVLCEGRFLQVLEGAPEVVTALYHRIARDPLHRDLRLLDVSRLDERSFADWGLKWMYASDSAAIRDTLLRYQSRAGFDPDLLSGTSAVALLSKLCHVL